MMKRILPALACALVLAPVLQAASASQVQTPEAVIEKYLAALGGRDALTKLTSRRATGTIAFKSGQGDLSGPYESSAKAPNKVRVLIKLDMTPLGMSDTMTIEQKFDGTSAITLNTLQGNTPISGSQLEHMKNNAFPSPVLNYKTNGLKLEMLPKEQVAGRDATVIQATPAAGPAMKLYFDPEGGLLVKSIVRLTVANQGEIEQVSEPSDYKTVDGVKVPFKIVNTSPGQTVVISITKVEHNVPLDDALFVVKGL